MIDLIRHPLYQPIPFLLITVIWIPFLKYKTANAAWNTAGLLYMGYIVCNTVFIWYSDGMWSYFFISLAMSVLYVFVAGTLVPALIRLLRITGPGESAMIFLWIIYHPVVLLFVMLIRWMFG